VGLGDLGKDTEGSRPSEIKINVASYLSSARNLSLLLLVLLIVSISVSSSYLSQVTDLQVARRGLAIDHAKRSIESLADSISNDEAQQLLNKPNSLGGFFRPSDYPIGPTTSVTGIGDLTVVIEGFSASDVIAWGKVRLDVVRDRGSWIRDRGSWTSRIDLLPAVMGRIGAHSPTSDRDTLQSMLRKTASLYLKPSPDSLWDIAFRWQIDPPPGSDHDEIYRRVERAFVTREVSLPSIGVGVSASTAIWWLASGIVGLSILMRNAIRFVERDPTSARSERWLLVDESMGLERLIAELWLWSIFLSPWIVGALLLMTVSSQVIADGVSATPALALARVMGLVAIPIVGGWTASSLVAKLIRLRRQRLAMGYSLSAK
jgi:hypothetical protein